MTYLFEMTIGDSGHDGHEKTATFAVLSNKDSNAVNAAWVKAKSEYPLLDPLTMHNDVEDFDLTQDVSQWLLDNHEEFFVSTTEESWNGLGWRWTDPQFYAEYVNIFTCLGDPELDLRIMKVPPYPANVGGYGLFWM